MKVLFVDACMRGAGVSRTRAICDAFLENLPDADTERAALADAPILPLSGAEAMRREALMRAGTTDDLIFDEARRIARADMVVIGAPLWDLSFPAALRAYIERIFARGITFRYTQTGAVEGLCRAKQCVYILSAGGYLGENTHGAAYVRDAMRMLGIEKFSVLSAEGLDIIGNDADAIVKDAMRRAADLAKSLS